MNIRGYENYKISRTGQVYSNYIKRNRKLCINKNTGYLQVSVMKNRKMKTMQVHRIVAEHYIPNPENKPQINHINGIKTDNRVENLEWVTDSENKLHCYESGLKDRNVISKPIYQLEKYTDEIIRKFESANEASRITGINQGNISNCCLGRCKSTGGYSWKFVK